MTPTLGFVTPEQFGGKKLSNTTMVGRQYDSTDAVQACLDSPNQMLVDGCYHIAGTVAVKQPKLIQMVGSPDLVNPVTGKHAIGCFYSGAEPRDMFHIFSEGFEIHGGLIDLRNTKYNANQPYYCQPSTFKYGYFYNLIQSGHISTAIIGNKSEVERYGAGHFGVSFDCSRRLPNDPRGRPNGFAEAHYLNFNLKGLWLHTLFHSSLDEPYQSYSGASLTHATAAGRFVQSTQVGDRHVAEVAGYAIPANARRYFAVHYGKDRILSFRAKYESGKNWADAINEAIVDKGVSLEEFRATSNTTDQSFQFHANQPFSIKVYRPCLATLGNLEFTSIGCKQALYLDTMDNFNIRGTIQTHPNLVKAPWDETLNEFDMPGATILGNNNTFDIHTVDLGKGSIPGVKEANRTAWVNYGEKNKPIGRSLESLQNGQAFSHSDLENYPAIQRNPRNFSHTNYGVQPSGGFIGDLDNALYLAHKRFSVSSNDGLARVLGLKNMFSAGAAGTAIVYLPEFDEQNGIVEISIQPAEGSTQLGLELLSIYLQFASVNTPRKVEVIVSGTGGTKTIPKNLIGGFQRWLEFETFNQNNNLGISLRLIGVKNKAKPVVIQQLAGKNKVATPETTPVLTKAGGTVYGPLYLDEVYVKRDSGAYEKL